MNPVEIQKKKNRKPISLSDSVLFVGFVCSRYFAYFPFHSGRSVCFLNRHPCDHVMTDTCIPRNLTTWPRDHIPKSHTHTLTNSHCSNICDHAISLLPVWKRPASGSIAKRTKRKSYVRLDAIPAVNWRSFCE